MLLLAGGLAELDLPGAIAHAKMPGTREIPALNSVLSLLALKAIGRRRVSHVDDVATDPALAAFAGMSSLPKATALGSYSYKLERAHDQALLEALAPRMLATGQTDGRDIDLDFHAIMHFGDDVALETHYVPRRSQRTESVLTLFAQDGQTRNLVYANADIHKATQADEVMRFVHHWRQATGSNPQLLVFDSKVTTGAGLADIDAEGIRFLTLRQRSPKVIEALEALPDDAWTTVTLDRKGRHRRPQVHEDTVTVRGCDVPLRQIAVRGLGHDHPTLILTNDRDARAGWLVNRYAKRMAIEQRLAEAIRSFHLDALSSSVALNVGLTPSPQPDSVRGGATVRPPMPRSPDPTTDRLPGVLQALFWPGEPVPSAGHLALWGIEDADLDEAIAQLGFPSGHPAVLRTVLPRTARARTRVAIADVPARLVTVLPATGALVALPPAEDAPVWRRPSDSVLAWSLAAKLATELVAAGRLVPGLRVAGERGVAGWRCAPGEDRRLEQVAVAMPPAGHALVRDEDETTVWQPEDLLRAYLDAVADACARGVSSRRPRSSQLAAGWVQALRSSDPVLDLPAGGQAIASELSAWAAPLVDVDRSGNGRLCLRLELPDDLAALDSHGPGRTDTETEGGTWRLEYLLQAADDPSLLIPAAEVWSQADGRLRAAEREFAEAQETLVRGLAGAARLFPALVSSLDESAPTRLNLDATTAGEFLTGSASLSAAGIGVLLPAELTAGGQRRLRARLRARTSTPAPGNERAGGLDADALASFTWEAALGDETIDADEFARIVALKQPLVRWRGQWVRVDPDEAATLATFVGDHRSADPAEVLAAALTGEQSIEGLGNVEVVADGALATFVTRLRDGTDLPPRLGRIHAQLRPYQARGVSWLQTLADLGLGGVLADDMGLGKTLQTIALLADRPGDRPHLVVCPVSVVGNWERELARFAPDLQVVRHHGPERPTEVDGFPPGAVVVTSYGLLRLDARLLTEVEWDVVAFDEAQQVKNHLTQAAKAARRLPATVRIALTGTPVENRLAELWSILDLTTPGLLGPFTRFRREYAAPIERWQDPDATRGLRLLTGPFVLRRTKADPTIAPDLPDKTELTVTCSLTREQATLYQAAVDEVFASDLGEGIERRGRILKLLTELKQICNHPAQYLGERGPLPGRSGKLARTLELLAEVVEAGDRALIFTQYRRMGELLAAHLAATLDVPDVPFLHGGVSRTGREAMVDAFQHDDAASPLLLVSLKAGGTGLNLTRATHVLHFDRWWNPAVEDQATDRAYRIGQHRTVLVHKLVTAGTLEERIARMIDDKRALADAVLGEGEAWLTELDDDALRDLVTLRAGDADDLDPLATDVEVPA